jgi:hypothetical protein
MSTDEETAKFVHIKQTKAMFFINFVSVYDNL